MMIARLAEHHSVRVAVLVAWTVSAHGPASVGAQQRTAVPLLDFLIVGGHVLDGTGNPSFRADVGIVGGRIVDLGRLGRRVARDTVDASGAVVAPGFIDLHSHAYDASGDSTGLGSSDPRRRAAPNLVAQGITTVAVNPDGSSPADPIHAQRARLKKLGVGPNVALFVGHNTLRRMVLGQDARRPASSAEVDRMRALLREDLRDGAFGLSAGLEYVSGRWSRSSELIELAREVAACDAVYTAHDRSAGDPMWYWPSQDPPGAPTLFDAARETVEIAESTGATVVASHIKVRGARYWGASQAIILLVEAARARGLSVWADQYPYNTSGSDAAMVLIPGWALGESEANFAVEGKRTGRDYRAALTRTLADTGAMRRLRRDVTYEIERHGGADNIVILASPNTLLVGKTLRQVASDANVSVVDAALGLQVTGDPQLAGGARLQGISLSDTDIDAYAARPWVATASDGGIALPTDTPVHPRFYGTFPRKLRRYALDRGVVSLEDAVRSMTSLPAQILGIHDRGQIALGYRADIVVLDPLKVRDRATFQSPHLYPEGVEWVFVNGKPVVARSQLTWTTPGEILVHSGSCDSMATRRAAKR